MHAIPTHSASSIDYLALITHLSHAPQLPSASSMRNQLLSHFCARPAACAAEPELEREREPWAAMQRFRPGSSTLLVGHVPPHLLCVEAQAPAQTQASASVPSVQSGGLWGVVHIYTSPGATNARVNVWLSSEPALYSSPHASSSSSSSAPPLSERFAQEEVLLRHMLHRLLPPALAALHAAGSLPPASSSDEAPVVVTATLCSLERSWLNLICSWAHADVGALQPLRQGSESLTPAASHGARAARAQKEQVKAMWANPCVTYQCDAETLRLSEEAGKGKERWKVAPIEGEGELELVSLRPSPPLPIAPQQRIAVGSVQQGTAQIAVRCVAGCM
jgi:hypothetical protein